MVYSSQVFLRGITKKMPTLGWKVLHKLNAPRLPPLKSLKWREERGLPKNPNSCGPLVNFPDYSFKDGRPVPFGCNQKRRIDKQREMLVRIKKLSDELDFAVEKHKQTLMKEAEEKQNIIDSKLKEKGTQQLLSSSV